MNDLISRQAAIREYQEVCKGMKCGECPLLIKVNTEKGSHLITDCKLEAFLHDLPSAQPEQRWIPCSERLPEDFEDVLVWFEYFRYGDYNRLYQTHGIGDYSSEFDSWIINHESGWRKLRVFAWMPLPKPYREERTEE